MKTITVAKPRIQTKKHHQNVSRILLFVAVYRRINGIKEFKELKVPIAERDGTIHEMIFDFLIWVRPFTGEDWELITRCPDIATDVLYHIENDEYKCKEQILATWRE